MRGKTLTSENDAQRPRRRITRRRLLLAGLGGLGLGGLTAGYARYIEPFWSKLERVTMNLPNLGHGWHGRRIIQLSDLHLERGLSGPYLNKQMERCTNLKPDLIVLTGDFITRGRSDLFADLVRLLERLKAPRGIYAVLGNHDYGIYSPLRRLTASRGAAAFARRTTDRLAAAGIEVLSNERRVVSIGEDQLQLVGLADHWSGFCDIPAAFAEVEPDQPCLALCHNPDLFPVLKDYPCDWVLSGHTHGGQVRIPFFGAPILPIRNRQYDAGLFDEDGKCLYVNRGLGYLRRIRFNCRPEITEFTLAAKA
ncbi:MAG: phosphodiesterase YaeI [Planctomycetota bacterium]